MFDHVTLRAADRDAAEAFYRTVLGSLGIEPTYAGEELIEWDDFSIIAADPDHGPTKHLHLAFVAPTPEDVDRFWKAGIDAGFRDAGAPGRRPQYRPEYYGAFLLDPDGNSAEAVHHGDTRRGGHIDHLWIRVSDLDAAQGFYETIA